MVAPQGVRPPADLDDLVSGRQVVRTHLMRRTVHLVTATDALADACAGHAVRRRFTGTGARRGR
ncbi:DNA glycosylase AlkZ-like family protein [Kitasatospora sp. NPDC056783]|uniref:DNA glycosylase AlkZ-like family protein n=1 Tax=Kitasatospora sp. NPDC056783 TaxID=3345943 RepID=UPI003678942D